MVVRLTNSMSGRSFECTVSQGDEVIEVIDVNSLSMRGARREITGKMIKNGYTPVDHWLIRTFTTDWGEGEDSIRTFNTSPEHHAIGPKGS